MRINKAIGPEHQNEKSPFLTRATFTRVPSLSSFSYRLSMALLQRTKLIGFLAWTLVLGSKSLFQNLQTLTPFDTLRISGTRLHRLLPSIILPSTIGPSAKLVSAGLHRVWKQKDWTMNSIRIIVGFFSSQAEIQASDESGYESSLKVVGRIGIMRRLTMTWSECNHQNRAPKHMGPGEPQTFIIFSSKIRPGAIGGYGRHPTEARHTVVSIATTYDSEEGQEPFTRFISFNLNLRRSSTSRCQQSVSSRGDNCVLVMAGFRDCSEVVDRRLDWLIRSK